MASEELMSSTEKRFLDELLQHYNLLATEAKKKHPHVKEACETGQIRVRNASSPRMLAAMGLQAALSAESQQILEPFFMGCDTKTPKMVQISINAMQKMIIFECLNSAAAGNLLLCLWTLMEGGIEEVKILQTITLLVTTSRLVVAEQLARTISLCFRLHYTKNPTTNNTASATIRQMVTVIFERVQAEDKVEKEKEKDASISSSSSSAVSTMVSEGSVNTSKSQAERLFEPVTGGHKSRYRPTKLKPAAVDAFNFLQDLIQIINGEAPFWLSTSSTDQQQQHNLVEIAKTFGLELLELIIDHYADVFHNHEEFAFLLKEKVCQLVIRLFSPNIKQRGGAQFSLLGPLLPKSSSHPSNSSLPSTVANSSHHSAQSSSSPLSPTSASSNASSSNSSSSIPLQVSQSPYWPVTVRLMRLVSVLIRHFFSSLITESEIFLSLLVKSLEVDKANWQRSIALEALYRMISPSMVAAACRHYDMRPDSSKILRDIVNALCIYIQSQLQVVDSTSTTSLLTSLVNNTNSGSHPAVGFIGQGNSGGGAQNVPGTARASTTTPHFPVFSLRGVSISLLYIPQHKVHRYRTFYIEQLEKAEPPVAPEGHGLSTALACILELVGAITAIVERDLGAEKPLDSQLSSSNLRTASQSRLVAVALLSEEVRAHHEALLGAAFGGLTGTFSLLLDASTDEVITELLLEQMRKLAALHGLYGQPVPRDALLLCMCKSALPAAYYPVPALDPNSIPFDSSFLPPKPADQHQQSSGVSTMATAASASSTLSLSSLSQYSLSNAAINLPNLLSQQNSGGNGQNGANQQQQNGSANINPNNPIVNANIMSSMGENSGGNGNNGNSGTSAASDFSRQIIAVGTAMPSPANSGTAASSTQAAGPVMLTSKNLQCMNSLLALSTAYGYVFGEQSWTIALTTLQHLVWILGLKPTSGGVYRLGHQKNASSSSLQGIQQGQQQLTNASQLAANDVSSSTNVSTANQSSSLITSAAMSDLPMLTSMLSRLFECTQYLDDEALIRLIKALISLSNESLEVAYNNREPSLFALAKLLETGLVNLPRINLIWKLVTLHLIEVSCHPFAKLREWGVDVLCQLVKAVLTALPALTSESEKAESDRANLQEERPSEITTTTANISNSQAFYLLALQALSPIKYLDIRQKQIECCLQLLQSGGEAITDGWPPIFAIIESATNSSSSDQSTPNEALVRCAFQCYQYVVSDLLPHVPPVYLSDCIRVAVSFGAQMAELNVSLTAVGLLWNVADYLHSNQAKIVAGLAETEEIEEKEVEDQSEKLQFQHLQLPFSEKRLTPLQSLWISLFRSLSNLCTDARLSVRKSSGQTLFSTLSTHGAALSGPAQLANDPNAWAAVFFTVLYPLMDSVRTLCSVASNERITYSESSMPKGGSTSSNASAMGGDGRSGGDHEYIIHYSRNTAFKQWAETVVLVLGGISRLLCMKLDLFLSSVMQQQQTTTTTEESSTSSQKDPTENNNSILLNIWSLYADFVYTSAVSSNTEVSTSALKCFNEIVHFLAEYQKTKTEAIIASSSAADSPQKVQALLRTLFPVWKIVWKTWCNIGHNIGPGKLQPPTPSTPQTPQQPQTPAEGSAVEVPPPPPPPVSAAAVLQQLPSQAFLCLLVKPLYYIFPKIAAHFTEGDFRNLSFVLQNAIATPFLNEPSVYNYASGGSSDQTALTQLQLEVMSVLERMGEQVLGNLGHLGHLLPLMYYQYLALSLYAVNIIPPHLGVFISSQFQQRFLPGELTQFNTASFYIFGERALKNAFNLYVATSREPVVIRSRILHSLIKAYKIPLCFRYSCPLQSTWRYTVGYFIKTMELGLPLARKYPTDFATIWADLALTFEGCLFPASKPPPTQSLDEQQVDESLDVKVVEVIRDHIMVHAQAIPKEFLLQTVSILNRGSIHSPSITSPHSAGSGSSGTNSGGSSNEAELGPPGSNNGGRHIGSGKLREDFARVCFQTLLQFSFFGPKGSPDLFIQSNSGNKQSPENHQQSIGIVNKLAVASILKRFNDVIVRYVEDEQLCPCPLPRHRLSEISFVLKALATLVTSLKEAPAGSVEIAVWRQLIDLYPKIVDCTMSNSPQVNKSIREVLHEYAYLLRCPMATTVQTTPSSTTSSSSSSSSSVSLEHSNGGQQTTIKSAMKGKSNRSKNANAVAMANGQNEVQI